MVEGEFDRFVFAKAVRFSHGQFCLVVETLNDAGGNRAFGMKPVEQQRAMLSQAAGYLLHRLQPRSHHALAPLVEKTPGPDRRLVLPKSLEVFAMQIGPYT